MLSVSLDKDIYGYGIFKKGKQLRQFLGSQHIIAHEGDEGEIQPEETIYKTKNAAGKIPYEGEEYELHLIGLIMTEEVLKNFCGKNILEEDIKFQLFQVKYKEKEVESLLM